MRRARWRASRVAHLGLNGSRRHPAVRAKRASKDERPRPSRAAYAATSRKESRLLLLVLVKCFDRSSELDRQWIAKAILGLADFGADPAFADAVLADICLFDALEANANVVLERLGVVIGATRVVGQPIGRRIVRGLGRRLGRRRGLRLGRRLGHWSIPFPSP